MSLDDLFTTDLPESGEVFTPKTTATDLPPELEKPNKELNEVTEEIHKNYMKRVDPHQITNFTSINEKTGEASIVDSYNFTKLIADLDLIKITPSAPDGIYYDEKTKLWNRENVREYICSRLLPTLTEGLRLSNWMTLSRRKDYADEIISHIRLKDAFSDDHFNIATAVTKEVKDLVYYVPFKNGTYDFRTDSIVPRDQNQYLTNYFRTELIPYDIEKETPAIVEWIKDLTGDSSQTLFEYIGYSFVRSYSIFNGFLIATDTKKINGSNGRNGKSAVFETIAQLFASAKTGVETTSAISLETLTSSKSSQFDLAYLQNKYVNFDGESNSKYLENTTALKKLTGGDTIQSDVKYKSAVSFNSHAKLYFAMNDLPNYNDASDGFNDRILIVPFQRNLRDDKEKQRISAIYDYKSADPEQLGKLAWYCIQQFRKLWCRDGQFKNITSFSTSELAKDVKKHWEQQNNKYSDFWGEEYEITNDPNDFISTTELTGAMLDFLKENGYHGENTRTAKQKVVAQLELKEIEGKPNDGTLRKKILGKTTRGIYGVKAIEEMSYTDDDDDDDDDGEDGEEIF